MRTVASRRAPPARKKKVLVVGAGFIGVECPPDRITPYLTCGHTAVTLGKGATGKMGHAAGHATPHARVGGSARG